MVLLKLGSGCQNCRTVDRAGLLSKIFFTKVRLETRAPCRWSHDPMHPTADQPALRLALWAVPQCQQARGRASQEGPSPCRKAPAHQPSAAKPVPEREQQPKQHIFNFKKPISTWPAYFFQIIGRKWSVSQSVLEGFGKFWTWFWRSSLRAQRGSTLCVTSTVFNYYTA